MLHFLTNLKRLDEKTITKKIQKLPLSKFTIHVIVEKILWEYMCLQNQIEILLRKHKK